MTTPRDFLGQELAVGDLVIYPVLSGRSCQMTLAKIIKMDVVTEAEEYASRAAEYDAVRRRGQIVVDGKWTPTDQATPEQIDGWIDRQIELNHRNAGTIRKATVQPVGISSRWRQHGWSKDHPVKPVHLSANAMSMVKAPTKHLAIEE